MGRCQGHAHNEKQHLDAVCTADASASFPRAKASAAAAALNIAAATA